MNKNISFHGKRLISIMLNFTKYTIKEFDDLLDLFGIKISSIEEIMEHPVKIEITSKYIYLINEDIIERININGNILKVVKDNATKSEA